MFPGAQLVSLEIRMNHATVSQWKEKKEKALDNVEQGVGLRSKLLQNNTDWWELRYHGGGRMNIKSTALVNTEREKHVSIRVINAPFAETGGWFCSHAK